jgi:hypothetical protein
MPEFVGYSTPAARLACTLLDRAWARNWATEPCLEPGAIVDAAAKKAGRRPLPGPWRDRLELLSRALRDEAMLSPLGRVIAFVQLVRIVASRAAAEQLWTDQAQIADRAIERPIAIVGQMRSGTTRMHRLLACDRRFAVTRMYETLRPIPGRGLDLRPARAWLEQQLLIRLNPALAAIHPATPLQAEEEYGLHAFSLHGAQFAAQWRVPSFAMMTDEPAPADVYREFAMLLRTIGWSRREDPARTWLLKAPQFMTDLPSLIAQFPDIRLIVLRRDRCAVVGSSASLSWHHRRLQTEDACLSSLGREWLKRSVRRERALDEALASHPHVPRITLDYEEVDQDWMKSVARVRDFLQMVPDERADRRMANYIDRAGDHRGHGYSLADFGLSPGQVEAAFG